MEKLIDLYKDINDKHTSEFLYKYSKSFAFINIFPSTNYSFIEAMYMGEPSDDQEKRIREIVRKLACCGIDLY